jgi:hypothetical protein
MMQFQNETSKIYYIPFLKKWSSRPAGSRPREKGASPELLQTSAATAEERLSSHIHKGPDSPIFYPSHK